MATLLVAREVPETGGDTLRRRPQETTLGQRRRHGRVDHARLDQDHGNAARREPMPQ
jgi:hypothetical protein